MSRRLKFYKRLLGKPNDVRFDDLKTFAEAIGFEVEFDGGSHVMFRYDGYTLSIPNHGIVKPIYIKKLLELINDFEIEIK